MTPISIGEIHVSGGSGLASARSLTLTSPLQNEAGLELFFAILAADAPKRVLEKLCGRLGEDLRAVFFQKGDPETRFEAALKQANKSILAFLYEHGLSLPGIKLRGAAAAISGGKLFVSSRGMMRGYLYVPQAEGLAPYALFEESSEKNGEPKFFTSLQAGAFPDGARLVIATSELFQILDESFVRELLGQEDFAKASREMKSALRATQKPVSILSLSSLIPSRVPEAFSAHRRNAAPKDHRKMARNAAPIIGPDIGEIIARSVRVTCWHAGNGIAASARYGWLFLKAAALLPAKLPRLATTLANREHRVQFVSRCKAVPDRCITAAIGRLNELPTQSRLRFFALIGIGTMFVHGLLFSIRHEVRAQTAKAYEAQLAELQRLEADFSSSMIYDNENRSRELVSRMETVLAALPGLTELQKKNKAEAERTILHSQEKLQKIVQIENPARFTSVSGNSLEYSSFSWFDGKLYAFSGVSGRVQVFSSEGTTVADQTISLLANGVRRAAPARTGFLLQGASGELVYWNPKTAEELSYDAADTKNEPILFYQGRLYAASLDGTVTRRTVSEKTLGTPSDVLRGAQGMPVSLATDGSVYLLYKDGTTRKYLKGASVQDYAPTTIEPTLTEAADLWASAESDRIVFIDKGGNRAIAIDRTTGRLLAQYTAREFENLRAGAVDESGRTLSLLTAGGSIYRIPIK